MLTRDRQLRKSEEPIKPEILAHQCTRFRTTNASPSSSSTACIAAKIARREHVKNCPVGIDTPSTLLKAIDPHALHYSESTYSRSHQLVFFSRVPVQRLSLSKCTLLPDKPGGCSCRGSKTISEVNDSSQTEPFFSPTREHWSNFCN